MELHRLRGNYDDGCTNRDLADIGSQLDITLESEVDVRSDTRTEFKNCLILAISPYISMPLL